MAGQAGAPDKETPAQHFSRLGIPISDAELERVEAAVRALTSGQEAALDDQSSDHDDQFDRLFELEKGRQNPEPQKVIDNALVEDDWTLDDITDRADAVQSRFGCFVDIFDKPFTGNPNALPIAIKDVFGFGSHRPTAGVPARSNHVSVSNSPVVDRLVRSGGAIVGTTKLSQWCYLPLEFNHLMEPPENPLGSNLLVGGSSSGSAVAVASGLVPVALGTDTGGSVRIPAALTGLYGFKPSAGRIEMDGVVPLGETQDTIGILASDVTHVSKLFAAIKSDHVELSGRLPKIGKPQDAFLNCDEEVLQGAELLSARLMKRVAHLADCGSLPMDAMNRSAGVLTGFEAARLHRHGVMAHPDDYAGAVRERLLVGLSIDEALYRQQRAKRSQLFEHVLDHVFGDNDFLMVPTVNLYAPSRAHCAADDPVAVSRMSLELLSTNRWVNLLGLPAIAVPVDLPGKSIATSIQLVGRSYRDEDLIELASRC